MSVVFNAVIKVNEDLEWYIQLTDTVDGRVQDCKDMDEFSRMVEEFGGDYGGNIDEVKWSKDDNVPPQAMDEIRSIMAQQQEDIEKLKQETNN